MTRRVARLLMAPGLGLIMLMSGCDKVPSRKLTDPLASEAVSQSAPTWVIYDEDLTTGGGAMLLPESANQELLFGSKQSAHSGVKSIYYSWNGGEVFDTTLGMQHLFAGFSILVGLNSSQLNTVPAKNLSPAGFTKVTFWARGSLSENTILRVEAPDDGNNKTSPPTLDISRSQLSTEWTQFTLPASGAIPASQFTNVKQYATFLFVFTQPTGTTNAGEGGYVYIDQITYEK
ncbi:MAG: hypothetical protein HY548_09185 [Elusimicrobia bacterium]|nr:hypothetical protein [Elusimicrobiota bacterium]